MMSLYCMYVIAITSSSSIIIIVLITISIIYAKVPGLPVVQQVLQMVLLLHLLVRSIQHRLQTQGISYTSVSELVADLFNPTTSVFKPDPKVLMETDQLKEVLRQN